MYSNYDPPILSSLKGMRETAAGYVALCPAHDDRSPSLSVTPVRDRWLLHCFAGCSVESVTEALGLSLSDLFLKESQNENFIGKNPECSIRVQQQQIEPKARRVGIRHYRQTAAFEYHNEAGRVVAVKRRFDFLAHFSDGTFAPSKRFVVEPSGIMLPLYSLPSVINAVRNRWPIWIAEGEAKADLLNDWIRHEWGIPAVATGNFNKRFAPLLEGAEIVVIPDRDEAGKRQADRIICSLTDVARSVRLFDTDSLFHSLPYSNGAFQ